MKKLGLALFFALFSKLAYAGVGCTLPFTLTNGTLADATQVMANYNALVTCLGNAAAAGANSDITSLSGLTTPISQQLGGTPVYIATTNSTGSGNAQVIATTTPGNFTLTPNFKVIFRAGFSNTGPTTLQVGTTAATNIVRRTTESSQPLQPLAGGEITANMIMEVVYDGTQFQLMSNVVPFPIGTVFETIAVNADSGFLLLNGQCVSNTTFNALWVKMGSPGAGGCAAGQFPLPDGRGRMVAMIDSAGSNRITVAGGNFDGTVLFNSGGSQNHLMALADLVAHTHGITDPGHVHAVQDSVAGNLATTGAGGYVLSVSSAGSTSNPGAATSNTTSITVNSSPAGSAFSILSPVLMLNRQIKY